MNWCICFLQAHNNKLFLFFQTAIMQKWAFSAMLNYIQAQNAPNSINAHEAYLFTIFFQKSLFCEKRKRLLNQNLSDSKASQKEYIVKLNYTSG